MNAKTEQLEDAFEYTQRMLEDAEVGNWDKVIEMETGRRELLEKIFFSPYGNDIVADINNEIRKIIDINKKLEIITINMRNNIVNDITSINKGRQAVDHYKQNIIY